MEEADPWVRLRRSQGVSLGRSAPGPDHVGVELDWLETYLAVVDRGGFTAASAQVHRSQSRVSAHIAALERELGVLLIDRTRRPASVTPAGRIFATHARDILADVGSARSAIGVLRAMDEESLAVLTTPCIGGALFPDVLAKLLVAHPRARVALSEHGWQDDGERRHPADGFVLAVLPTCRTRRHPECRNSCCGGNRCWRWSRSTTYWPGRPPAGAAEPPRSAASGEVGHFDPAAGRISAGGQRDVGERRAGDRLHAGRPGPGHRSPNHG